MDRLAYSYLEPYHTETMSRTRSRNTSRKQSSDKPSFYANSGDSTFAREKLMMEEPFRYFPNVSYLCKPAEVTDALRNAHARLAIYDRNSMKGGVGRMLKNDGELIDRITRFFNTNGADGTQGGTNTAATNHDNEQHGGEWVVSE